jgi:hypothetical protein
MTKSRITLIGDSRRHVPLAVGRARGFFEVVASAAILLALASCVRAETEHAPELPCELGRVVECPCADGPPGVQECSEDGYGACDCGDELGASAAQSGGQGGSSGSGGADAGGQGGAQNEPPCEDGAYYACECPGSMLGETLCEDGVYGQCDCGTPTELKKECEYDDGATVSMSCTCSDGRDGYRTCEADGFFGPCECVKDPCDYDENMLVSFGCTCSAGGPGRTTCEADGFWSACECD